MRFFMVCDVVCIVVRIPYTDCDKHYIGKIQRSLENRIYEHKRSIKSNDDRTPLFFYHRFKCKNSPISNNSI